jgi:hypothetical protein
VDLVGKGGHVRTVPVPDWVRNELNDWLVAAAIDRGKLQPHSDAIAAKPAVCWDHVANRRRNSMERWTYAKT